MLDKIDLMKLENFAFKIDNELKKELDKLFKNFKKMIAYYAKPEACIDFLDMCKNKFNSGTDEFIKELTLNDFINSSFVKLPSIDMANAFYYSQKKDSCNHEEHINMALRYVKCLELEARIKIAKYSRRILKEYDL